MAVIGLTGSTSTLAPPIETIAQSHQPDHFPAIVLYCKESNEQILQLEFLRR